VKEELLVSFKSLFIEFFELNDVLRNYSFFKKVIFDTYLSNNKLKCNSKNDCLVLY
jgi:hypothetical protein